MESSTSQRPKLVKTRSTSSRIKKLGRTPSKYGSIIEEEDSKSSNEEEEEEGQEQDQEHDLQSRSERLSMNSFDHELTLKDKQDVIKKNKQEKAAYSFCYRL